MLHHASTSSPLFQALGVVLGSCYSLAFVLGSCYPFAFVLGSCYPFTFAWGPGTSWRLSWGPLPLSRLSWGYVLHLAPAGESAVNPGPRPAPLVPVSLRQPLCLGWVGSS